LDHVLEAVTDSFSVTEAGRAREALPFSEPKSIPFPPPIGERDAYLFPWSDVVYYPTTLGAKTATGRFALDPPWAGRLASLVVRFGGRAALRRPGGMATFRRAIQRLRFRTTHHGAFALVVTAENGGRALRATLSGTGQADATAAGAAEYVRALAGGEITKAGVWLPEQVLSADRFLARLSALGWQSPLDRVR
jgi:saccharopine dehydrogenase-like NADP-dependent oxidoreductase